MKTTDFVGANMTLGKPRGMTDEECGDLRAFRDPEKNTYASRWEPTAEEIADIVAGKPVWLTVLGAGHPPVMLSTEGPFGNQSNSELGRPLP